MRESVLSGRRRRGGALYGASCSKSPRLLRGAVGGFVGLLGGSLLGWLGSVALMPTSRDDATMSRGKTMAIVYTGTTLAGVGLGAYLGARNPEC